MTPSNRIVSGNSVLAAAAAGLITATADVAQAAPGYTIMRQLTNITTGTIESVKAVSELFAPVSGEVTAVNADLGTHPEAVNGKPHETWMIRVRPSDPAEAGSLLDASAYMELVK